ncbi:EAL domain-containing protein [Lyngbya confervoides BDU141951]|uniref:EAL domain-containing protein n=2 Tax=Lyngbya TaxID=28073 RepID=A0ABD4T6U9_9CYAN|nr:EAL domain-containing protein [Lyngbya confervoides BDU141951]
MKILEIENSLRLAIENQDFELYYQPILDLKTGEIRSFEALIRWCHPDKGLISPADFIPLAEDTGLIIPLGNWIIKAAFQQLRQWIDQDLSLPSLSICINISGRQFSNPDFVTILQRMLKDYPVPPENIELEITEGAIMHREDLVIEKLHQLKEIGFKLSIDDFGTGYSSLSYLQLFPVDTLKVDRSFVSQMGDHDSYEIVKTIMTLAHNLNLDVVAEGVEDSKQATLLQAMNCEYAQGYLYSPPLSTEKATRFLADSQGA